MLWGMIKYSVKTIRAAGLQARWTRTRLGAPIISANAGKGWYVVGRDMWNAMKAEGVRPAFERFTLLGDIFSIPA
jgi:hypothetical protein